MEEDSGTSSSETALYGLVVMGFRRTNVMNLGESNQSSGSVGLSPAFIKIMAAMTAAVVLAIWVKTSSKRPGLSPPAAITEPRQETRPEIPTGANVLIPRAKTFENVHPIPPATSYSNVVGASDNYFVLRTLQPVAELGSRGISSQGEAPASYRIPSSRSVELSSDFSNIASSSNRLAELSEQISSIRQVLQKDTRDYLAKVRENGATMQGQREIALQKLIEMQAQWTARKQEYLQEIGSLKASLQDPLPVLDQKLIRKQEAELRYQKDMGELESVILKLQQEVYAASQGQRQSMSMAEFAYRQASESGLQSITNINIQIQAQIVSLNALIANYNEKLRSYGTKEP
jgi:hypothetical protein